MALTETYVDPSIAADSGTGTVGDPYGDLQYALNQVTRDATNGDRFNVKAGTDEILTAALDLTSYGTAPTALAPLVFQGYTTAADDGGIGGISGNGSVAVYADTATDYIRFVDLHMHNCGSATIITADNNICLIRCELDNTTGSGALIDNQAKVLDCYFHNIGTIGLQVLGSSFVWHNYFANGTNDFTVAIDILQDANYCGYNVINVDGSSDGISVGGDSAFLLNNSIYSNAGTGQGISDDANNLYEYVIMNNIIEGFSGTGGIGIDLDTDVDIVAYGGNALYNNATNYGTIGDVTKTYGDNETLSSSVFTAPGSEDFTVGTDVQATAIPLSFNGGSTDQALDKGAAQRVEAGGGGGPVGQSRIIQNIGTY